MILPPDHAQREAAINERSRNVVVDAGAGTGKTTLLVSRLLEMVAPADDARAAIPLERIAAVTFTRKAAGELRLRIRERLLSELSSAPGSAAFSDARRDRLRLALAALDTAHIGTVHSFADRLLRRHPVESRLSPTYDIVEDEEVLLRETYETLVTTSEKGTLSGLLAGRESEARADEARETVLAYIGAGLQAETEELEFTSRFGLDAVVAGLIRSRDIPLADPPPPPFMRAAFGEAAKAGAKHLAAASGDHFPGRWMRRAAEELSELANENDPGSVLHRLMRLKKNSLKNPTRGRDFQGDKADWAIWKAWSEGTKAKKDEEAQAPLEKAVLRPVLRWIAKRLVRLRPVVLDLYEQVKQRHRAVDQIDLLVKLRDLLRENFPVRAEYQRLFDHLFIDEFQDTDPLQAEIALFLCEANPIAKRWQDAKLADGRLTIVGDPKQSIYRFRRADISMYARVRELVGRGALSVTLSASFRARPPLVDYLNERFNHVLGEQADDRLFDPDKGSVTNQPLERGREEVAPDKNGLTPPAVRILELLSDDEETNADGWRKIEARALARYLKWLVETKRFSIADPNDGHERPVRFGDIAVLAVATTTLRGLFDELDGMGVPHVSRGGTLFLGDPLHQQFLLGLRAIADKDDGVAEAALLRPPFFSIDLAEIAQARACKIDATKDVGEGAMRAGVARAWLQDARRRRFERTPGETARALLEETAFGRTVALGPNGPQRLARLRELCLIVEQRASAERLDYDGVTEDLRRWVDGPVALDPPPAVGVDAVQVLTVHQAKGLEFPVVVLWDSRANWQARNFGGAWRVNRDGDGWLLKLAEVVWNEPEDQDLVGLEGNYLDEERKRIIYVAATRARDLLVLPRSAPSNKTALVNDVLAASPDAAAVSDEAPYLDSNPPAWARSVAEPEAPSIAFDKRTARELGDRWLAASGEVRKDRFSPTAVETEAEARVRARVEDELVTPAKARPGRFGATFGTTVHVAIGACLGRPGRMVVEAVARAAADSGLTEHLDEAAADVERALKVLADGGMGGAVGRDLFVEYPLAGATAAGKLVRGYADLVHVNADEIRIVDFKTDAPGAEVTGAMFPDYVEQVRTYAELLGPVAGGRRVSGALLFTATGTLVSAT